MAVESRKCKHIEIPSISVVLHVADNTGKITAYPFDMSLAEFNVNFPLLTIFVCINHICPPLPPLLEFCEANENRCWNAWNALEWRNERERREREREREREERKKEISVFQFFSSNQASKLAKFKLASVLLFQLHIRHRCSERWIQTKQDPERWITTELEEDI